MDSFGWRRLMLIGFIVVLLVAIPVALYLLKNQQNLKTHATPATTISFSPTSSSSSPINNSVGSSIPLQLNINPGTNLVTAVKLFIQYDPTVLSATTGALVINSNKFPTVIDGPTYTPGLISASISVGADLTSALSAPTTIGTITFSAIGPTSGNPTQVQITNQSAVYSAGGSDQAAENVLLPGTPAFITISGAGVTGTPTPTTVPGQPTATPTPTTAPGQPTATTVPASTNTPTLTLTPTNAAVSTPTTAAVNTNAPTSSPTIAPTGSSDVTFGVGAFLTVITVVGGIMLFVL